MASNYTPNKWELYNNELPNESQPHSFITKRKLDRMEKGIEDANIELEVGEVTIGEDYNVSIIEDEKNKTRRLNVTFPPAGKGDPGEDGKSAYDIWIEAGNIGTEQEFLDYLKGIDGKDGRDGRDGRDGQQGPSGESAYQIWLNAGNTGTQQDFFNSLKGSKGDTGLSSYDVWKTIPGNENKSIDEFIASLKGEKGEKGEKGDPGQGGSIEFIDF